MTAAGSSGVASPSPEKHSVTGGLTTVTSGSPPICSHVPVHSVAVSGPQPVVSGRKPLPVPPNCGPGVVLVPLPLPGPELHVPETQSPVLQSLPPVQASPGSPVPVFVPFVPPVPLLPLPPPPLVPSPTQAPSVQSPLAQSLPVS